MAGPKMGLMFSTRISIGFRGCNPGECKGIAGGEKKCQAKNVQSDKTEGLTGSPKVFIFIAYGPAMP